MNFRDGADAVVVRDSEVMIEHPAGRVGTWPATQVRGEGVKVRHVPVHQQ